MKELFFTIMIGVYSVSVFAGESLRCTSSDYLFTIQNETDSVSLKNVYSLEVYDLESGNLISNQPINGAVPGQFYSTGNQIGLINENDLFQALLQKLVFPSGGGQASASSSSPSDIKIALIFFDGVLYSTTPVIEENILLSNRVEVSYANLLGSRFRLSSRLSNFDLSSDTLKCRF